MDVAGQLRELAEPYSRGEKAVPMIERIARLAGLSYSRCYEIYYRRARQIKPEEIAKIQEALRIKNERAARNELHQAKLILARLEARLNAGDADFYRADIDGLRAQTSGMGGRNSTKR